MADKRTGAFGRTARLNGFEIARVVSRGKRLFGGEVMGWILHRSAGGGPDGPRLGISIGRKVGGAVRRNRLKRLLRESFRLNRRRLRPETDLVISPRPGCGWKGLGCAEEALMEFCRKADIILREP